MTLIDFINSLPDVEDVTQGEVYINYDDDHDVLYLRIGEPTPNYEEGIEK